MLAFFKLANLPCHHIRQIQRGCERLLRAPCDNRLGNRLGKALFAIIANHARQLRLIHTAQPLRRCQPACVVHAHVQRPVLTKAKTPFSFVNLRRAHAQVQQNAIHALRRQMRRHGFKTVMHHMYARIIFSQFLRGLNRARVFIKHPQLTLFTQLRQDQARMTASPKRPIDIHSVGLNS